MKKIVNCSFIVIILLAFVFLAISFFGNDDIKIMVDNESLIDYDTGWTYRINNQEKEVIDTFPLRLDTEKNDIVTIENTLPEVAWHEVVLQLYSHKQFVKVYVNDALIYTVDETSVGVFGSAPGSGDNYIRIEDYRAGDTIKIEYHRPLPNNEIDIIYLGSKSAGITDLIHEGIVSFVVSIILLIMGVLLILSYLISLLDKKSKSNNSMLFLGLTSLFAVGWSLIDIKLLQIFIPDQVSLLFTSYLFLSLLPVPFLLLVREQCQMNNYKRFHVLVLMHLSYTLTAIILQMLNVVHLYDTLIICHILIGITFCVCLYTLCVDIFIKKDKQLYTIGIGVLTLLGFSALNLLGYYLFNLSDMSLFFRVGFIFFLCILSFDSLRKQILRVEKETKTELLAKLAYLDTATGLKNRNCFEKDMSFYRENAELTSHLVMGIFDINNLKVTNDTLSHKKGDELIATLVKCLNDVFKDACGVYRIGGDEFVVMLDNVNHEDFMVYKENFDKCLAKSNEGNDVALSVASYLTMFDTRLDNNIDDLFLRTDNLMYEEKKQMKQL